MSSFKKNTIIFYCMDVSTSTQPVLFRWTQLTSSNIMSSVKLMKFHTYPGVSMVYISRRLSYLSVKTFIVLLNATKFSIGGIPFCTPSRNCKHVPKSYFLYSVYSAFFSTC